jgi:hypothetical protein
VRSLGGLEEIVVNESGRSGYDMTFRSWPIGRYVNIALHRQDCQDFLTEAPQQVIACPDCWNAAGRTVPSLQTRTRGAVPDDRGSVVTTIVKKTALPGMKTSCRQPMTAHELR